MQVQPQSTGGERPKRSGNVQAKDYESETYLKTLEPLVKWLQEDIPQARYDRKNLGQLVAQLLQFMEDALGVNALPPKPFPKLPVRLLEDVTPDGPLHLIAAHCHSIVKQRGLKRIDFSNPGRRKENLEILAALRRELVHEGHLRQPHVCLHPSLPAADLQRLQRVVEQLGGELAASEGAPGVTHVVLPFGPDGDPDDGQEYMRTLRREGALARVHFWYTPDSYDQNLPADVAPEKLEPDKGIRGPWKVYVRWVTDSAKYNEWCNPIDYETEEALAEQERLGLVLPPQKAEPAAEPAAGPMSAAAQGEGAADGGGEPSAKRQRLDAPAEAAKPAGPRTEIDPGRGERLAPGLVRQALLDADRRALDSAAPSLNLSQGQPGPAELGAGAPRVPLAPQPPGTGAQFRA